MTNPLAGSAREKDESMGFADNINDEQIALDECISEIKKLQEENIELKKKITLLEEYKWKYENLCK